MIYPFPSTCIHKTGLGLYAAQGRCGPSITGWTQETVRAGVGILGLPAGPGARTHMGTQGHAHRGQLGSELTGGGTQVWPKHILSICKILFLPDLPPPRPATLRASVPFPQGSKPDTFTSLGGQKRRHGVGLWQVFIIRPGEASRKKDVPLYNNMLFFFLFSHT